MTRRASSPRSSSPSTRARRPRPSPRRPSPAPTDRTGTTADYTAAVPSERLAIAQVTPFAWEASHELGDYVARVSDELSRRGHRVLIIAPSESGALVRDTRGGTSTHADVLIDSAG